MTELTRIEEMEIHRGSYVERSMGLVWGIALMAGCFGAEGLLGVALLAGAALVALDR